MTLQEILTAAGLDEEATTKVLNDMKEHKIYTTSVENADTRYSKLKEKADGLAGQLAEANTALEGFKSQNPEQLQADYTKLKTDFEALQGQSTKALRDQAIDFNVKNMLKESRAKQKYMDMLMSKIDKESLELGEDGSVAGLQDVFKTLTTEYSDLFEAEQPQLRGTPPANNGSSGSENSALYDQIREIMNRR